MEILKRTVVLVFVVCAITAIIAFGYTLLTDPAIREFTWKIVKIGGAIGLFLGVVSFVWSLVELLLVGSSAAIGAGALMLKELWQNRQK